MPSVEYQRAWRARNPEKAETSRRKSHLKTYGLTPDEYAGLLLLQGGVCAVAECTAEVADSKGRRLHIDHDHSCCPGRKSCGKCVRGLLCSRHNILLPDSLDEARAYVKYLEDHNG